METGPRDTPLTTLGGGRFDTRRPISGWLGALARVASRLRPKRHDGNVLEQISHERRMLEQVLQQLPSGVLLADTDGRIVLQNEISKQMFGVHAPTDEPSWEMASELMDTPVDELPLLRALRTGEATIRQLIRFRRPDGREILLSVNAGPVRNDEGRVVGAVAAFDDVTEPQRIALDLAEEGRVRERFMAILGHDLRTPIAAITMSAQLLQRSGALDGPQRDLLDRIVSSSRRMERMIRELLDLGRIRAGRIELDRRPCNLTEIVGEVVDELRIAWPDRTIETDLDGVAIGHWDADRLMQVVSNLVGNALTHGSPEHPVRVRLRHDGREARLEVRNAGPAIPSDLVTNLSRPFRGQQHRTRRSGLGLGLFISHALVTAHGGSMSLDHSGSEVVSTVRLPREPPTTARGS